MALPTAIAVGLQFSAGRAPAMNPAPLFDERDVQAMWDARATRGDVRCRRCGKGHVGLSISDLRSYRWRCIACGSESPWFFVKEGAVRLHAHPQVGGHLASLDDEP